MNSQKSLRNDTGLDNYHNNVDAQSVFSNPLDYSINEQWERYKTSEKNSQEQIVTNNRYDPIKSYPLPKTEPSTGIIRNDFRTPLTSDYIEPVSEDRAVFVDNHENSGSYLPQSTMTTIQQKSPPREKAPDEDRYVRVTGGDYPIFVKKQEPAYQPSTTFQNTNNSFRTNATSRPTIEQDPFIKRMNELRGVYDDMKRNIKTGQQDPTNNYFVNIKKPDKQLEPERSRAETLQDNIIITPIAQTLPLTPNPQINPDPSQASLITISNQPTKRDSNPKVPNLPPLKDKIKMITSGGAGSRKSSASNKPPITKKMSRSVLEEKRSSERLSSNEGSQTLLHIKPQRQTFGKEGLPPSDRRPMVKRPDPREVKERYTMKVTPAPPTHSRKTSKVGDIILLNDMNLSSHGDQNMTYDGALSKDSLLNQDSFMLKDPSFAEQRTKRPLMPIKVRSKSALKYKFTLIVTLRVLKEVSPDEKFEYDESVSP